MATGPCVAELSGQRSLSAFAREHSLPLTRFAYLLCHDHQLAEDLVQDAFLALYRRFGSTLPVEAPVAYARRVIVNAQISRGRKRAAGEFVTDRVPEQAADALGGEPDVVWQQLSRLPERQRAVLVMRYYVDLTDADIASVLGCRPGTVRSLAARAFVALRADPDLGRTEESS